MTRFTPAESSWIERLGNLRNVIRQEMITRQLAPLVADGMTVLDVGCGQGNTGSAPGIIRVVSSPGSIRPPTFCGCVTRQPFPTAWTS